MEKRKNDLIGIIARFFSSYLPNLKDLNLPDYWSHAALIYENDFILERDVPTLQQIIYDMQRSLKGNKNIEITGFRGKGKRDFFINAVKDDSPRIIRISFTDTYIAISIAR